MREGVTNKGGGYRAAQKGVTNKVEKSDRLRQVQV